MQSGALSKGTVRTIGRNKQRTQEIHSARERGHLVVFCFRTKPFVPVSLPAVVRTQAQRCTKGAIGISEMEMSSSRKPLRFWGDGGSHPSPRSTARRSCACHDDGPGCGAATEVPPSAIGQQHVIRTVGIYAYVYIHTVHSHNGTAPNHR